MAQQLIFRLLVFALKRKISQITLSIIIIFWLTFHDVHVQHCLSDTLYLMLEYMYVHVIIIGLYHYDDGSAAKLAECKYVRGEAILSWKRCTFFFCHCALDFFMYMYIHVRSICTCTALHERWVKFWCANHRACACAWGTCVISVSAHTPSEHTLKRYKVRC